MWYYHTVKSKSLACLALLSSVVAVVAQTSSFTYQGRFSSNGTPADGQFDFRFTLHATPDLTNQVGSAVVIAPLGVTNGLFTTALDFGSGVFDGSARWLQMGVRTNGDTNAYVLLSPRQLVTSTPYAIRAANYSGPLAATNLTGKLPDSALSTNVALLNSNATFAGNVTAASFTGSGVGLVNIAATNLTGTLPDARLSTNVALKNAGANFAGNVSAPFFFGNGTGLTNVPGRIFEVIPTSANIQSLANTGYLATNDLVPVVVTLPLNANIRVGETIRVSGSGAGGWILAQNAGQSILVGNLLAGIGQNWSLRAGNLAWRGVASSVDGSKLAAVVNAGNIYTSTDYGANWTPRATGLGALNWRAIASSGDGVNLVAVINAGVVYTSGDSGVNWNSHGPIANWTSVASSLNGVNLVACAGSGALYTSSNSGVNWTARTANANWVSVASSADGVKLAAALSGGQIYTSTDSGANWVPHENNRLWVSVASSSDGSRLVAAVGSGQIYTSADSGTNWVVTTAPNSTAWTAVASSADGARLAAVFGSGGLYLSEDSGLTWVQRNALPNTVLFSGVTMSADASTIAAVGNPSQIYVSSQAATTTGVAGSLTGTRLSAVEVVYCGNGVFMPITSMGTVRAK
jgi:photosystem II stability/assembly factor-like uncharacterized protein